MALGSLTDFSIARTHDEVLFTNKLNRDKMFLGHQVVSAKQCGVEWDKRHIDIVATLLDLDGKPFNVIIDVKHSSYESSYSISKYLYQDAIANQNKYKLHFLALVEKLIDSNGLLIETGKHIIVKLASYLDKLELKHTANGDSFYVLHLQDVYKCKKYRIM